MDFLERFLKDMNFCERNTQQPRKETYLQECFKLDTCRDFWRFDFHE